MGEARDPKGQIIRHTHARERSGVVYLKEKEMAAIESHVQSHVGGDYSVLHEIVSEGVHVDVLLFPPTSTRRSVVLCTMGASAMEMTVPDGWEYPRRIELMAVLPADWPIHKLDSMTDAAGGVAEGDAATERWYWPIRLLKQLAHLPSMYETMLWWGHTVPNGDPPEPFADNTRLCCASLVCPEAFGESMATTVIGGVPLLKKTRKEVVFFAIAPLFPEEVDRKLKAGMEAIDEGLQAMGIERWFDPNRTNLGL